MVAGSGRAGSLRYWLLLLSWNLGWIAAGLLVFDYFVSFQPNWRASSADRLLGFSPWCNYLSTGHGLLLMMCSVLGLLVGALIWVLPDHYRRHDCCRHRHWNLAASLLPTARFTSP